MSSHYAETGIVNWDHISCWNIGFSVGELMTGGSGRAQPLTLPRTTASAVIVVVVVHLHIAAVSATIGATGTARELGLLIQLDSFLVFDLFHSDFPFKLSIILQFFAGNYLLCQRS